ncbi:MAG: hypothetical protein HY663_07125 [Chloroflexi bacterium]|nr:hypothetical protein [Chloroflexota bacterium]
MKLAPKILIATIIIVIPLLAACSSSSVSAAAITSIGQKVNCVCGGCSLTVITCDDNAGQSCDTANKQVKLIRKGLSAGQTEEQIIRNMANVYGRRALVE